MIKFESDLAAPSNVTVLPYGYYDQLDEWLVEQTWAEWAELTFDPDL